MNIELRNVKYAAFASQETACFEAAIYIDGKKAGTVGNDGHGGCNWYHPRSVEDRLTAHAKTLPNMKSEYSPEGLEMNADLLVGSLADEFLLSRDLARMLKAKLVFARGGKILSTKKLPAGRLAFLLRDAEATRIHNKADAILNAMPFAEALALYRNNAA